MTAIAAPASVQPSAPAPAGGYDKDAAEGFGALLAQAAGAANDKATNDKTSPRDARDADKSADRAQDAKTSSVKAAGRGQPGPCAPGRRGSGQAGVKPAQVPRRRWPAA